MARKFASNIGEIAEHVLAGVKSGGTTKTASATPTGETGVAMMKVAELLREEAKAEISYADLQKFRVTHGV